MGTLCRMKSRIGIVVSEKHPSCCKRSTSARIPSSASTSSPLSGSVRPSKSLSHLSGAGSSISMEPSSFFAWPTRKGPLSAEQFARAEASMVLLGSVIRTAVLLAWLSGIAGVKRRESPFNDRRRNEGPVDAIGFLAEHPACANTAQRTPQSKDLFGCSSIGKELQRTGVRGRLGLDTANQKKFPHLTSRSTTSFLCSLTKD